MNRRDLRKRTTLNRVMRGLLLTSLLWGVASHTLWAEDLTLKEVTTSTAPMGGNQKVTNTNYFSSTAMKHSSSDGNDFIIRYDQRKIISIDNKKKTYSQTSFDELQKMINKAAGEANLSQEEQEALKQVMGQTMGQVSVQKQGAGEPIVGHPTEKYLIQMAPLEIQVWATSELTMPEVYYDAIKISMPRNPMFDMAKMYEEFKKIKGMPLKSVTNMKMMGMSMTTTTEVTSVEKGAIPGSVFEIPAGYKETQLKF
ncbi:MAG: DUF4412 domain-containing protein [Acidobacteria bacterium]|nr:DUF4412 domain-containing protein [Acidobacteriota bacterium]